MRPFAGLALAALLGVGATPAGDPGYALSVGEHAALRLAGVPGRLLLVPFCDCERVSRGTIWFDDHGTGTRHVLLTVFSDSNPDRPNGQCGAGEEGTLLWLKVKPPYRVLDSQAFLVASCWHTVEEAASPKTATAPLAWRFKTVANDGVSRDYVVTFDRQAPGLGLHAHYTFEPW